MEVKKNPKANLENHTVLFFLLGTVLTLLTVYLGIEHKTYDRNIDGLVAVTSDHDDEEDIPDVVIEQIVQPVKPPPPAPEKIEIVEDEKEVEETVIESTETDESEKVEVEEIVEVEEEEYFDEDVAFAIIEDVPVFPGCKGTKQQKKDCLNTSMKKHVARKFNAELAGDLGLSGKQKIYIQFKITKTGGIEILGARAPHPRLEKEAKRVVNLLPKMTPGKQRGRPVNVTYMLPIVFDVQ
ncbi:energy transducer TonB [Urechidicola croceus]|uniref:Energy transducer TonB n=1 Tax=Urechidicola croceus TaxID=1850246 RepID=A0A1D8P8J3_9FLAO|nr:energy transducer TonB [Urechidicola croceus]AOW20886.1 energy transducer TonB [Urechidicola croceus]